MIRLLLHCAIAAMLLLVSPVLAVDSHSPQPWTPPPSAIRSITAASLPPQVPDAWVAPSGRFAGPTPVPSAVGEASPAGALRLPRWSGTEADHEVPAVSTALPAARPAASHSLAQLIGIASNMGPGFGPTYLALPQGRGWIARICGPAACITRVSTDVGPERWTGRVADLNVADFEKVSGQSWLIGLTTVSVVLEGRKP